MEQLEKLNEETERNKQKSMCCIPSHMRCAIVHVLIVITTLISTLLYTGKGHKEEKKKVRKGAGSKGQAKPKSRCHWERMVFGCEKSSIHFL